MCLFTEAARRGLAAFSYLVVIAIQVRVKPESAGHAARIAWAERVPALVASAKDGLDRRSLLACFKDTAVSSGMILLV
ncbi:hypothetical protein [Ciceribacter azotifigens]|uniref:hypothetical protein n=1 Tax=Ciceribacter azotifigens TaxID=2069303 RepID=UPI003A895652